MSIYNLDEAITHCEEKANEMRREGWRLEDIACIECAKEHEQLAEWLKELKARREEKPLKGEWIEDNDPRLGAFFTEGWKCSICGDRQTYGPHSPFCMNCGVEMQGKDIFPKSERRGDNK